MYGAVENGTVCTARVNTVLQLNYGTVRFEPIRSERYVSKRTCKYGTGMERQSPVNYGKLLYVTVCMIGTTQYVNIVRTCRTVSYRSLLTVMHGLRPYLQCRFVQFIAVLYRTITIPYYTILFRIVSNRTYQYRMTQYNMNGTVRFGKSVRYNLVW